MRSRVFREGLPLPRSMATRELMPTLARSASSCWLIPSSFRRSRMVIPICSILLQGASTITVIFQIPALRFRRKQAALNQFLYGGVLPGKSANLPLNQHFGEPNAPAEFLKHRSADGRCIPNGRSLFEQAFFQCEDGRTQMHLCVEQVVRRCKPILARPGGKEREVLQVGIAVAKQVIE